MVIMVIMYCTHCIAWEWQQTANAAHLICTAGGSTFTKCGQAAAISASTSNCTCSSSAKLCSCCLSFSGGVSSKDRSAASITRAPCLDKPRAIDSPSATLFNLL